MSFRARLALASALAVAVAVAAASLGAYVLVRDQLEGRASTGRSQARIGRGPGRPDEIQEIPGRARRARRLRPARRRGRARRTGRATPRPSCRCRTRPGRSSEGETTAAFENATVDGTPLRIYTVQVRDGVALQLARPRDEVDARARPRPDGARRSSARRRRSSPACSGCWSAGRRSARSRGWRTRRRRSRRRGDLSRRVGITGADEVGRLGSRFDAMLAALERSEEAQRMLVADASHELRTPITSVRTNVELLAPSPRSAGGRARRRARDGAAELEELSARSSPTSSSSPATAS